MFLWGPPGVGKSDVVRQVAEGEKLDLIDIRAVLLDPVDLRGLPHINGGGYAHWCPPAFLPHDPKSQGILFLDELNAAPQLTQSACYQLVLDRKLGEYQLPDGWAVIAAGNRETDRSVVHRMPSALANRFMHINFDVDKEEWCAWAAQNKIVPEIISFIRFMPGKLHEFDPKRDDKSFPTPRSWEFLSRMMPHLSQDIEYSVMQGTVGDGAAAEFIGYLKVYRNLPDVNEILADPKKARIPKDSATRYAICGYLASCANKQNIARLAVYFNRMDAEFGMLAMRESYHRCKDIAEDESFALWAATNMQVLV